MWSQCISDSPRRDAYAQYLREANARYGAFLSVLPAARWPLRPADGSAAQQPLAGVPIAVKDNIAVEGMPLTCASRVLEGFISPYSATAVERLQAAGGWVVGKTNLDEFGMGSSTDNSALGKTHNPWDVNRVAGGSSGGSAAAVAAGMVPIGIGSDTGGSVRQPAAFCGLYGLKPTYGAVSRYGLVAYASSLEVVGVVASSVAWLRAAYGAMRGFDPLDQTTAEATAQSASGAPTTKRIAVLAGNLGLSTAVQRSYDAMIERVRALGYAVEPVELTTLEYGVSAYYTIAAAEASANLARYNGVRYGYRPDYAENPEELMRKARSEAFGNEVKMRIVLGTYVLRSGFQDQYYTRAQKVRTLIRRELTALFERVDGLLLPVFPTQAFAHGAAEMDQFQQKLADRFTTTANLAAVPALAIPSSVEDGLPVGVQLMGAAFSEDRLLNLAAQLANQEQGVAFPPGIVPFSTQSGPGER